jgi:hypothetical protein
MAEKDRHERRIRVERGIYRQPNVRYAVCFMAHGKPCFRRVGGDLQAAEVSERP